LFLEIGVYVGAIVFWMLVISKASCETERYLIKKLWFFK